MADIDKVVKGLECCWASFPKCRGCPVCPYEKICYHDKACNELLRDALELLKEQDDALEQMRIDNEDLRECYAEQLKEQEAKNVIESTNTYTGLPITHCPKCGVSIDRYLYGRQHEGQINYCPYCGQAVKFE